MIVLPASAISSMNPVRLVAVSSGTSLMRRRWGPPSGTSMAKAARAAARPARVRPPGRPFCSPPILASSALDRAREAGPVRVHHCAAQLVEHHPGRLVSLGTDLLLEREDRQAAVVRDHQEGGQEPERELRARAVEDGCSQSSRPGGRRRRTRGRGAWRSGRPARRRSAGSGTPPASAGLRGRPRRPPQCRSGAGTRSGCAGTGDRRPSPDTTCRGS